MIRGVRRFLATVAVLATVVLATVALGLDASAAPHRCLKTTLKQDAIAADSVFRGVVQRGSGVHGSGRHATRAYRVRADRVYQGSLVTRSPVVTVRVAANGCELLAGRLTKGDRYIFFATERGTRLMAAATTTKATRSLTQKVVALLGTGKQPQLAAITPEFTKLDGANPPALSRLLAPGAAVAIVSLLGLLVVGRLGRRT